MTSIRGAMAVAQARTKIIRLTKRSKKKGFRTVCAVQVFVPDAKAWRVSETMAFDAAQRELRNTRIRIALEQLGVAEAAVLAPMYGDQCSEWSEAVRQCMRDKRKVDQ